MSNKNVAPGGPGISSSEFLAFLVGVAVVLLDGTSHFTIPQEYVYGVFGLVAAFGGGRTFLKSRPGAVAKYFAEGGEIPVYRQHAPGGGYVPPPPPDRFRTVGEFEDRRKPSNE